MTLRSTWILAALVGSLALFGCGDDDGGGGGGTPDPADAGTTESVTSTLTLEVPDDFTGTPRELDVFLADELPLAGPPSEILHMEESPSITAGDSIDLELDTTDIEGDYYVMAVIYVEGGGTFQPMAGVDYMAQSDAQMTFAGESVDMGSLTFAVVE